MLATLAAMDPVTLAAFIGAGVLLNLTPGSDVLFATASGVRGGWRAGVAAAAGISCGSLCHVALTAAGMAAALQAMPGMLEAIRWIGAAYLLFLAWQSWHAPATTDSARGAASLSRAFGRGLLTNVLNPKVALFILAFLPQFTDPGIGPVWQQIVALGVIFAMTGFVITSAYGALAGAFGQALNTRARALNRIAALVFAGLAVRLAFD